MFPQSAGRKVRFNSFSWFVSNVWKPESPPPPQVYLWVFPQFALVLKKRTRRSFSLHFFFLFLVFDGVNDAAGRLPAFSFMASSSFFLQSWMKLHISLILKRTGAVQQKQDLSVTDEPEHTWRLAAVTQQLKHSLLAGTENTEMCSVISSSRLSTHTQ